MRIYVAGIALRGSGYPNAERTVALLQRSGLCEVEDHADWLPPDARLWRLVGSGWIERAALLIGLVLRGGRQAISLWARARKDDFAYVPYPAPFTLWWLSFVPEHVRPRCVVDVYISLWDSLARDRTRGKQKSLAVRAIFHVERRALRAAHRVVADTASNKRRLSSDFGIETCRLRAFPLAINADPFLVMRSNKIKKSGPLTVLFFGTFVPLHGIGCVLGAIDALAQDDRLRFQLIGDGQQSGEVEAFFRTSSRQNAVWKREWMGLDKLAEAVSSADVCLGVFGGEGKAARVLPFKAYYALAAGKPLVTQRELSLPDDVPVPPFLWVDGQDLSSRIQSLVQRLKELAGNPELRASLGKESESYFDAHLSEKAVLARWADLLHEKR